MHTPLRLAWLSPNPRGRVSSSVFDESTLHTRALVAGAIEGRCLQDTDYGSREFAVRDLQRGAWSFGTYLPRPPALT